MKKVIIPILVAIAVITVGILIYEQYTNEERGINNTRFYTELTYNEFKTKIENKDTFVLLVHQTDCPHCEAFMPIYKSVANQYEFQVYGVNRFEMTKEEYAEFSEFANISGTPTTIFITEGEETTTANRMVGAHTRKDLVSKFQSLGYIE